MGLVEGHPAKADGKSIQTSRLVASEGRVVTTRSGSKYELVGPPSKEWETWLAENGFPPVDHENPFTITSDKDPQ